MCLLDASGIILDFDPEFAELTQLDADLELRGRALAELLRWAPSLPTTQPTVARRERGDGEVELSCRRAFAGPVAYTLTARWLRGESALAVQLRVARQTLDSVIHASPLALVTVDRRKRVVMWNSAAERMFGWTEAEILGQPYPLVPDGDRESFEQLFEQVVFEGEGYTGIEATRRRKDGAQIEVNMHTASLRDADGRGTGAMAMFEDLTEKRQLQARARESAKMEAIGRLAGGIAHDFNNLLTVVIGSGDLLLFDPSLSDAARERVEEIIRVGHSARELVAQLMTFSRRQVTQPEDLDIHERLRADARLLERVLGETIELRLALGREPVRVRIDPAQFDQIVVNLAVNARDAMPSGGVLEIRSRVVERERGGEVGGGRDLCLEIRDQGVGIAAEVLPHIFEPFFTTKADRPDAPGTGLGLANVYGIVRHAGGDVVVESEVGVGTCFRVCLPIVEQPKLRPRSEANRAVVPRGRERLLLVEDNDAVRKSTSKLLAALGYEVETACDGSDALARFDELAVDLVLTDLAMPKMGGAELAKQLRSRAPGLPIVFMSGNLDVADLREEVEQGRARFLQKPVSLRDLAQVTREVLDATQGRTEGQ